MRPARAPIGLNLTGNAAANTLIGNDADNFLDGGTEADTLAGLAGDDTYILDNAGDVAYEFANAGTDLVKIGFGSAGGTYDLSLLANANIEHAMLTNTAVANLTGNSLNNHLTGNAAANSLCRRLGRRHA